MMPLERATRLAEIVYYIAASVGVIAVFVGLLLTRSQIQENAKAVRANTTYLIARDGRNIAASLDKSGTKTGLVVNFISSVHYQWKLGIVDDTFWEPFKNEVCTFLRDYDEFWLYWSDDTKRLYPKDFVDFIQQLGKNPACKKQRAGQ